jgi:hypothetical protein
VSLEYPRWSTLHTHTLYTHAYIAQVSDASIIAADSSARALLPSLAAAVAAASAVLALLRAH